MGRFKVGPIEVDGITLDDARTKVMEAVHRQEKNYLAFCTASSVVAASSSPLVERAINGAGLVCPDGMPLVWLARRKGFAEASRVYGPDLMRAVFVSRPGRTLRHYFFGGAEGVADAAATNMRTSYQGLQVAGCHSPRDDAEIIATDRDIQRINKAKPDVVWIGLGHPKQEVWMHLNQSRIEAPVLAGVGAAFDFLAGIKVEAPLWMQRIGVQWLHRLVSEPRRLWRRYLIGNSIFVLIVIRDTVRKGGA